MISCSYSQEEAQKLIKNVDQKLIESGAITEKLKEDMNKLKEKSKKNIRKLSLLL